ncbi:Dehydrogenase xptC [Fusarium oxysporum f. sp. raphani]|nr:Dehydrogenase xptC [Fusarium oxysporum f. sp. raphani]
MPRNFTYVLNQLRMDTMAQCTSPTLTSVLEGFAQLGLPVIGDVNNGTAAGAMILPSSMQPDNQTRFDAREAHFNSASRRYNLHIATNQTVTQLVLDSNSAHNSSRRVMGVEFAPRNKSKARSISCTREVIVSAGAIFTPTLLQVSGIGPSDVLKSLDILVKIDLPGVGCNLQDHPMVYANYYYRNESYFRSNEIADGVYDEAAEEYIRNRTDHQTLMKHVMEKISTEGHPSGTAAMMPLELGGVVDPELKVYGTCSLRIADASIMPLIPSAHLQASAYGIAEKAADMIKSAKLDCRIGERLPFPPRSRPAI